MVQESRVSESGSKTGQMLGQRVGRIDWPKYISGHRPSGSGVARFSSRVRTSKIELRITSGSDYDILRTTLAQDNSLTREPITRESPATSTYIIAVSQTLPALNTIPKMKIESRYAYFGFFHMDLIPVLLTSCLLSLVFVVFHSMNLLPIDVFISS